MEAKTEKVDRSVSSQSYMSNGTSHGPLSPTNQALGRWKSIKERPVRPIKAAKRTSEDERIEKSLKPSVREAASTSAVSGIADSYIGPFAIELGASNLQIGFLTSVMNFFAPLSQLFTLKKLNEGMSKKSIVMFSLFIHFILLIPILLIPFLFKENRVMILMILFVLYSIFAYLFSPAWALWMGDLVPDRVRGEFFAKRNKVAGIVTLITTLVAGLVLNHYTDNIFYGYMLIFGAAVFFGFISLVFLAQQYEPKYGSSRKRFDFRDVFTSIEDKNYKRFVLYISLLRVAVNIAAPFFAVYMLRDLQFSYMQFSLVTVFSSLAGFLTFTHWGKSIDKFGNVYVIRATGFLVALSPILWLFSSNFYWILTLQIFGGVMWAGFNLATFNFINDAIPRDKRALSFTFFNIFTGMGVFIGATAGGFLANVKLPFLDNAFFTVFLLSGILRFLMAAIFVFRINEVRYVEKGKPILEFFGVTPIYTHVKKVVMDEYVIPRVVPKKVRLKKRWLIKYLFSDEYG